MLMFDAVSAHNVPANAECVAGYINGRYAWNEADWGAFPNAIKVAIQIYIPGSNVFPGGLVLDIEASDMDRAIREGQHVRFAQASKGAGIVPTLYSSKDPYRRYASEFEGWDLWLADPGPMHLLPGCVATQYGYPGPYDVSQLSSYWPRGLRGSAKGPVLTDMQYQTCEIPDKPGCFWGVQLTDGGVEAVGDGAPYLGNLLDHPEWGVPTQAHQIVGIVPQHYPGGWGYQIHVYFVDDNRLHPYDFQPK